jgi:2-keto-4-pentenoate hydratase/2-oxohepta-3-ene-1,7-dioic acid hydratase in catechol pathway
MKIIITNANEQFYLIPDSALLLKNRPFFCPDYVENLHAKLLLVVKINRLGKYIQEKFAPTYYDEVGFAINFYDKTSLKNQIQQGFPWERATCFDGSFALSEFMKISETIGDVLNVRAYCNTPLHGQNEQTLPFDFQQIPQIISELSTFMTLKIGDYIAIELGEANSAPFEINDVLQLSLNDKEIVRVVIK